MKKKKKNKPIRDDIFSKQREIKQIYGADGHKQVFQDRIKSVLSEAFTARWGSPGEERPCVPSIVNITYSMLQFEMEKRNMGGGCRVSMLVSYVIDYHGIYAKRSEKHNIHLNPGLSVSACAEKILGQEDVFLDLLRNGVLLLPDVFPEDQIGKMAQDPFSKVSFLDSDADYRQNKDVPFMEVLRRVQHRGEVLNHATGWEITRRIQESLRSAGKLPDGAHPIENVKCSVRLPMDSIFSYSLTVDYRIFFQGDSTPYTLTSTIPIPGLFPIFREKNANAKGDIFTIFKREIVNEFDRAYKSLPYFKIEPPDDLRPVLESMRSDGSIHGKVRILCESDFDYKKNITYFLSEEGTVRAVKWEKDKGIQVGAAFDSSFLKNIDWISKKKIPNNPINFYYFCKEAAGLYAKFEDKRLQETPKLTFFCGENYGPVCMWNNQSVSMSSIFGNEENCEETLQARTLGLFKHIADVEYNQQVEYKQQTEILPTLNSTELAILKIINKDKGDELSQINEALEDKVVTTKGSTKIFLNHLCETYIVQGEKRVPILTCRQLSISRRKHFWMYLSSVKWDSDALCNAVPRPFKLEELDFIIPSKRKSVFLESLKSCNDPESRWQALQFLEKMPRQFTIDFAKSKGGRDFFQAITGDDAIYAQLFLESLPGCKRLAKMYFPAMS